MNIFKNLLFQQGYLTDAREAEYEEAALFAQRYGNRVASEQAFAPLGHARSQPERAALEAAPRGCA